MYNNTSKFRNIDIPENLFSNLGESKKARKRPIIKEENDNILKNYNIDEDIKLTNLSNKNSYRERINKMYENISDLTPVNSEIDNVLYFNNYIERGIVVKPKISSLKQFWTEYRLIKNEKKRPKNFIEKKKEIDLKPLDNFDELFEALSKRVTEINNYIDELKEMREEIDNSNKKLENDKEELEKERQSFMDYKIQEENKIKAEKESLKINYDRLQTIINDLDNKLNEIETK